MHTLVNISRMESLTIQLLKCIRKPMPQSVLIPHSLRKHQKKELLAKDTTERNSTLNKEKIESDKFWLLPPRNNNRIYVSKINEVCKLTIEFIYFIFLIDFVVVPFPYLSIQKKQTKIFHWQI